MPGRWKPRVADRASVPVYFSNPDLLWATDFPAPRFGQGAFAAALRTLYQQVSLSDILAHITLDAKSLLRFREISNHDNLL